jgi:hypothetical protein
LFDRRCLFKHKAFGARSMHKAVNVLRILATGWFAAAT